MTVRILMFNSSLSKSSGVMSVIMNYYRNIDRENVQFDFMYFREFEARYNEEIEKLGGLCFRVVEPTHIFKFGKNLSDVLSKSGGYDTVHIHDPIFARFMYGTLKKCGVKNVIVHSHATKYSDKKLSELRNWLTCRNITRYADVCCACSEAAGKFMFGENDFFVMKNAIETDKYEYSAESRDAVRKTLNVSDNFVIGHIGAFEIRKNHKFLLDVFREIRAVRQDAVLLLAGDGPLFEEMKEYADSLGISAGVLFLGKRKDADKLYQAMDVFVLPSLYEGLPMVGVEAQCAGLPVVFSSEITEEAGIGKCLFLSLSEGAGVWAEKIIRFYDDNKERDRLCGAADLKRSGFDIKEEANNIMKRYLSLNGRE